MKITVNSIKKAVLLTGGLFLSVLSVNADDIQDELNYFRTPEASAFMKYGEESVNEYTGTANISVPLYTIKCKDIEIPLVLNYNASGIKVEQEASWVGLGWDLTVGGCINYVCSGSKDMMNAAQIPDDSWTEYLTTAETQYLGTTKKIPWYTEKTRDKSIWMSTVPYENSFIGPYSENVNNGWGVKQYLDCGYGERDFYSVNILGKSFMFFIDPYTLNVYNIGQAGEEFKVELEYTLGNVKPGLGKQSDIKEWKITDSDGFVYYFKERDIINEPNNAQTEYTSCWYLTEIKSPTMGGDVKFSYTKCEKQNRSKRIESLDIPIIVQASEALFNKTDVFPHGSGNTPYFLSAQVTHSYVKTIKTQNQTVIFNTSKCYGNSGMRLDSIMVLSYENDTVKNYVFSYGSFDYSRIGGNDGPSTSYGETVYRLKLDYIKEIASGAPYTTKFSYNSIALPSIRSCARDYWGYYNGQENKKGATGHHTLIPVPNKFMSFLYGPELREYEKSTEYADRFSRGYYMQAGILNGVVYPTGGYTKYEYEPNTILTNDFTLSDKYRERERERGNGYDVSVEASFSVSPSPYGSSADQSSQKKYFHLSGEATCDLSLMCRSGDDTMYGQDMHILIYRCNNQTIISTEKDITVKCPSSNKESLQSLTLPAGDYALQINPPSKTGNAYGLHCYLKGWYKSTFSQGPYTLTCGGLRIRKICKYDNDNALIDSITYNYNNYKGSTGVLLDNIETIDVHKSKYFRSTPTYPSKDEFAYANVYTITPGRSRMSEFYASYNPGIVGYSQVTKRIYDSKGNIEKIIVTDFRNTAPKNNIVDYYLYEDCYNGKIVTQDILDANSKLKLRINNTYNIKLENHYAVNMWHQHDNIIGSSSSASYSGDNIPKTTIWRYPYILSRVELAMATTTEYCSNGMTIVRTKGYSYNPKNHQVSQIDENTSLSNQIKRTKITYTVDDEKNKSIANNHHRLNAVVESKNILVENGKENCISTQRTDYKDGTYTFSLPRSSSTSVGNASLEERTKYTYDNENNIRSVTIDGNETIYVWSYNSQYPIAKIEGITFDDLTMAMFNPETAPASIEDVDSEYRDKTKKEFGKIEINKIIRETDRGKIKTFITTLRKKVTEAGGYVTTYTYKPLVGITSETSPNGNTVYYEYDAFGRLKNVKDINYKTLKSYEYNYKK